MAEKTSLENRRDNFYAHLDVCRQCEQHPFDLCAIGHELIMWNNKVSRQLAAQKEQ